MAYFHPKSLNYKESIKLVVGPPTTYHLSSSQERRDDESPGRSSQLDQPPSMMWH